MNSSPTEKELLSIVECLKKLVGIIFRYKIDVFSDHKNLVYKATIRASQRVMQWVLILEDFGPNIQHIPGIDNKAVDTLSYLPSENINRDESSIMNYSC